MDQGHFSELLACSFDRPTFFSIFIPLQMYFFVGDLYLHEIRAQMQRLNLWIFSFINQKSPFLSFENIC